MIIIQIYVRGIWMVRYYQDPPTTGTIKREVRNELYPILWDEDRIVLTDLNSRDELDNDVPFTESRDIRAFSPFSGAPQSILYIKYCMFRLLYKILYVSLMMNLIF